MAPKKTENSESNFWMSLADIMSTLMMIFLLISISYMIKVNQENEKLVEAAQKHKVIKKKLYEELKEEFKKNFEPWGATLDSTDVSFKFNNSSMLFSPGNSNIKEAFQKILNNFFPRYVNIIMKDDYIDYIIEIGIEAHTAHEWKNSEHLTPKQVYFKDIELSQDRTRNVLKYILSNLTSNNNENWLIKKLGPNGLSSSRRLLKDDSEKVRIVEFLVKIDAERSIKKVLELKNKKLKIRESSKIKLFEKSN